VDEDGGFHGIIPGAIRDAAILMQLGPMAKAVHADAETTLAPAEKQKNLPQRRKYAKKDWTADEHS
jgi:hypothetical protein